jgi:hypothetical protein
MESAHREQQVILWLLFAFLLVFCSKPHIPPKIVARDFSFLQNGDLIYRQGNGYFSNHFRAFSEKDKVYSHVGIVQKTADSIFVIHAEASELTGIGFVKKETVSVFLEGMKVWAAYRVRTDEEGKNVIAAFALQFYENKTPFDANFDIADTASVYCTELAALCVNKALGETTIAANTVKSGRKFIAIDDTYLHEQAELIFQVSENDPKKQ